MFALLMSLHVLAAIIGLGPTFSFPFLGIMAEKEPSATLALHKTVLNISTYLVIPVTLTMAVTGVLLIANRHLNLSKSPWLGAGIILYVLVVAAAIFYQVPVQKKLIALVGAGSGSADQPGINRALNGQRIVGIAQALAVVVIAVLMIWKPGARA